MTYHRLLIAALLLSAAHAQAQDNASPTHVIVTYKVFPDKRAAFRANLNLRISRFTHWRDDGAITSFQILESSLADDEGWETMALVQLGQRGLELAKRFDQPNAAEIASTTTVPVDLIEHAASPAETSTAGVYLVIPYELVGSGEDYRDMVRSYAVPQLNARMKEGGLLSYQIFMARFPGGRSWNSVVVLHYLDWIALGQREKTVDPRQRGIVREKVAVIAESIAAK